MKKLVFFLISLLFSVSFFATPVLAQENNRNIVVNENQTINNDYFATGDTVTILGTVNGDVYAAGGTITIDGTINGDILATGGTLNIRGTAQNIRVAGGTVTISGTVQRNVTVLGGTINLDENANLGGSLVTAGGTINMHSPIEKGASIAGGTVTINNTINDNVYASVGQLTLQPNARINGDLNYTSSQKAQILEGAVVSGQQTQTMPQKDKEDEKKKAFLGLAGAALFFKLINMASILVIGLLIILLAPAYLKRVTNGIVNRPWLSLGVGFIALLLTPMIIFALFLTIIGIPLAVILTVLFGILLYVARIFVMYLIGEKIGTSINRKMPMWLMFIIGLLIYEIVVLIPLIGWLIDIVALLFGLGSILLQKKYMYSTLRKEKIV